MKEAKVMGREVRLDLQNSKSQITQSATLWIDLKTREPVKAIYNGKRVFPKFALLTPLCLLAIGLVVLAIGRQYIILHRRRSQPAQS